MKTTKLGDIKCNGGGIVKRIFNLNERKMKKTKQEGDYRKYFHN